MENLIDFLKWVIVIIFFAISGCSLALQDDSQIITRDIETSILLPTSIEFPTLSPVPSISSTETEIISPTQSSSFTPTIIPTRTPLLYFDSLSIEQRMKILEDLHSSALFITVTGSVDLLLTDAQGRRVGKKPGSDEVYEEIPFTTYSYNPSENKWWIIVPSPVIGDSILSIYATKEGNVRIFSSFADLDAMSQYGFVYREMKEGDNEEYIYYVPESSFELPIIPEYNASSEKIGSVGEPVAFYGTAFDPDPEEILTIKWDFGDGQFAFGEPETTHIYEKAGIYTATLTISDLDGFVLTDTTAIQITQNPFVILGIEGLLFAENVQVTLGDIGVKNISDGPFLTDKEFEVVIEDFSFRAYSTNIFGNRISVNGNRVPLVDGVYTNFIEYQHDFSEALEMPYPFPLNVPLIEPPIFFENEKMDKTILPYETIELKEGSYGNIDMGNNSELLLLGGKYFFENILAGQNVNIKILAGAEIVIRGRFVTGSEFDFSPEESSELFAWDIKVIVLGVNEDQNNPAFGVTAVDIGDHSNIRGHIYVPNGTLTVDDWSVLTGSFIGKWISIDEYCKIILEGL